MKQYILPVADLYAYSLLPNHFHLLIKVKPIEILMAYFKLKKNKPFVSRNNSIPDFIMEQFSNWLNGYAKAFNKMFNRKGSLFIDYTKRIEARSESDVTSFIFYIHKNAVHHGLRKTIGEWEFDSYNSILGEGPTDLMRQEIIDWFGSKKLFVNFHKQPINLKTHSKTYKVFKTL